MKLDEALKIVAAGPFYAAGDEPDEETLAAVEVINAAAMGRLQEGMRYSPLWAAFCAFGAVCAALSAYDMWSGTASFWYVFITQIIIAMMMVVWALQALTGWRAPK